MSMDLFQAFVPTARQIVQAGQAVLDKGEAFCAERGMAPETLIETRLAPDMAALPFQVFSVAHHSAGAIAGVRAGVFKPARPEAGLDFSGLKALLQGADAVLAAVTADEMAALSDKPMVFSIGDRQMPFVAADFLLSFSQPNFFFHASMLYGILRHAGVGLGKIDFLGRLRLAS
ncbi:MAG: DUF1993 domain-containing protein [Polymorphobacter sp.]|uniref:DUF1993 domain-containing protein n=1 Tax=Polymorphobacter sp. TaxID=1909290 RepID=UPI003A8A78AD